MGVVTITDDDSGSIRGNSYYAKVSGTTWSTAESAAVSIGGHLVTINDSGENSWLHSEFNIIGITGGGDNYWTGFKNDSNLPSSQGDWKWVSGENSTYTNWKTG